MQSILHSNTHQLLCLITCQLCALQRYDTVAFLKTTIAGSAVHEERAQPVIVVGVHRAQRGEFVKIAGLIEIRYNIYRYLRCFWSADVI